MQTRRAVSLFLLPTGGGTDSSEQSALLELEPRRLCANEAGPRVASKRAAVASRVRLAFNQLARRCAVLTFVLPCSVFPLFGATWINTQPWAAEFVPRRSCGRRLIALSRPETIVTNSCRSRANGIVVRCFQQQLQEQLSPTTRPPLERCELPFCKDRLAEAEFAKLLARTPAYYLSANESRSLFQAIPPTALNLF